MGKEQVITSGQLFILLFVCRISSVLMYESAISIGKTVFSMLFPMLIFSVISFLLILPVVFFRRETINGYRMPLKCEKLLYAAFLVYFVFMSVFHLRIIYGFIYSFGGESVNRAGLMIFLILVVLYASIKGLESIVRFASLSFATVIIAAGMLIFFLYPLYDVESLMPEQSFSDEWATVFSAVEDFAVIFILSLTVKGNFVRSAGFFIIFQGIFFVAVIILLGGTVGEYLIGMDYPFFRSIDGSEVLQRFEPFFFGVAISAAVCRAAADFYIIHRMLRKLFSDEKTVRRLYYPMILIISCFVLFFMGTTAEIIFQRKFVIIPVLVAGVLIPFILTAVIVVKKRKKIFRAMSVILCILSITVIFSGCTAIQLNQRIIVQGIGIDKSENKYTMTYIVLDTESHDENSFRIIHSEGESVETAVMSMEQQRGRSILLTQCLFIMMNEEAARDKNTLSYFRENRDIIKTVNLMACENARDIILSAVNDYRFTAEQINGVTDSKAVNQSAVHLSVFDEICCRKNGYKDIIMPYVKKISETESLDASESFLLRDDGKKFDILTDEETQGIIFLNGQIPESDDLGKRAVKCSSEFEIDFKNGKMYLQINVKVVTTGNYSVEERGRVRESFYRLVNSSVSSAVIKNGCDVISLNRVFRSRFQDISVTPEEWRNILENMTFRCSVHE